MDPLRRDDLETRLGTTPEERARQLLDVMRAGYRLKRAALRLRHPRASDEELDARFQLWLDGDDRA